MTFILTSCDSLSLAQLAQARKEGFSVMRSAHAGNLYAANLAVAQMGIPIILYDRVFGKKDLVSHPNLVIRSGKNERVCSDFVLMVRARIDHTPSLESVRFQRGQRVAAAHLQALRDLFPGKWIRLWTPYLSSHAEFVTAILEAVSKKYPDIWYRRVDENGLVVEKLPHNTAPRGGWSAVEKNMFGLTNPTGGWLMSNAMNVLINACTEARETNHSVVYHTGGMDMAGYMSNQMPLIEKYFEAAKSVPGVPAKLDFRFATITPMRFAGPAEKASAITALFECSREYVRFDAAAGRRIQDAPDRQIAIGDINSQRGEIRKRFRVAVANAMECLYDVRDGVFFSQYDALAQGLYVHQEACHTPLNELARISGHMCRAWNPARR